MDGQFWNCRHLDRTHVRCLVGSIDLYPSRMAARHVLLAASQFQPGRFIEDRVDKKGSLGAGGSVATSAWDFCRQLGAETIYLAGLDLSYPGSKTHYKGATFEGQSLNGATRLNPAENASFHAIRAAAPYKAIAQNGGSVTTDKRLALYASWFERQAFLFPSVKSFRLSRDGMEQPLAIKGMETADIGELLSLPERRHEIDTILDEAFVLTESAFYKEPASSIREAAFDAAYRDLTDGLESLSKTRSLEAVKKSPVKDVAGFLFQTPADGNEDAFFASLHDAARFMKEELDASLH
jgi:hypothetical protein